MGPRGERALGGAVDDEEEPETVDSPVRVRNWARWGLAAAAAVAGTYLVVQLHKILLLFYLASLLGIAINSFVLKLERRGISRKLAVGGLAVLFVAAVVTVGYWVIPPAIYQAQNLMQRGPDYVAQGQSLLARLVDRYPGLEHQIGSSAQLTHKALAGSEKYLGRVGDWAIRVGTAIFSAFILFVLVVFGLMNPRPMAGALFDMTPPDHHDRLERTLASVHEKIVAWAGGTFILMAIVGVVIVTGLSLLRVPQALLFGIIAGLGEGIPTLGPVMASIPPTLTTLVTDPVRAVAVIALFVVVQQTESNVLVPIVMGNRLRVHPWGLIFMILMMGDLFGFVGLFLATPTAAILEVVYQEWVPKPGRESTVPTSTRVGRVFGGLESPDVEQC